MNHSEICHIWANKSRESDSGFAMSFQGAYLFTWQTHLAKHLDRGAVLVNETSYSNSSAKHRSHMWRAISHFPDSDVFRIGDLDRGDVLRDITGTQVYEYALAQAVDQWGKANRARVHRDFHCDRATEWIRRANRANEFFHLRRQPLVESSGTLEKLAGKLARMSAAQERRAAKARKQEEARCAEALQREIVETRELFTDWRAGRISEVHASIGAILRVLGTTGNGFSPNAALRLNDDNTRVETSQGAQVLVRTVRFLWEYCVGARAAGQAVSEEITSRFPRLDHYTLNTIDAHGNVTAGCHRIAFAEIERIAKGLNLPPFNGQPMQEARTPAETVNN